MRFLILAALAFVSWPALALPRLILSHVQHFYAGGGGCVERFWLEWEGSEEITDIEILVELKSEKDESLSEVLRLARLGITTSDRTSEATVETPRCLAGSPSIIVKQASATVSSVRIHLLQSGRLRVGEVVRYPLNISGPTIHSTGPARKAAQPGEFKR
ncbi:hypothetical protein [Geopseudomonas aromaticivorans]